MPSSPPIRAKRTDDRPDEFFYPIPNRDLTEEEYQALEQDQRKLVRESGLWEVATDKEMEPRLRRFERTTQRGATRDDGPPDSQSPSSLQGTAPKQSE